jgi:hypothetical protein
MAAFVLVSSAVLTMWNSAPPFLACGGRVANVLRRRWGSPAHRLGHRKAAWLAFEHVQVFAKGAPNCVQQIHRSPADRANDLVGGCEIFAHGVAMDATANSVLDVDQRALAGAHGDGRSTRRVVSTLTGMGRSRHWTNIARWTTETVASSTAIDPKNRASSGLPSLDRQRQTRPRRIRLVRLPSRSAGP